MLVLLPHGLGSPDVTDARACARRQPKLGRGSLAMLCTVSADAVHDYRTRGYAVLHGCIAPARLEVMRKMVGEVSALAGAIHVHELLPTGEVALARTEDFATRHEGMAQLLREFGGVAEALAGEPVHLLKEKVHYRPPGSGGYRPHQDDYTAIAAPRWRARFVTPILMAALDDATPQNGAPELAPLGWVGRRLATPDALARLPFVSVPLRRGDVLIYDNYMPHRSAQNRARTSRGTLFAVFSPAAAGDLRSAYYDAEREGRRNQAAGALGGRANVYWEGAPAFNATRQCESEVEVT